MEIYIFVQETRCFFEDCNDVKPFKTMEEAKAYFQEAVKGFKQDAIDDEWIIDRDSETSFEAWEDGCECHNHYYFNILTFTI